MVGGDSSVLSIPNDVKKVIQGIKEIFTSHSKEEIYDMLRECSMNTNDTVQKLLMQDPLHEVKKKRDRKKEIMNYVSGKENGISSVYRKEAGSGKGDLGISLLRSVVESNHGSFEESAFKISRSSRISCMAGSMNLPIGSDETASKMPSNEGEIGEKIISSGERKQLANYHRHNGSNPSYSQSRTSTAWSSSHVSSSRKVAPIMQWRPKSTTKPPVQLSGSTHVAAEDNLGLNLGDLGLSDDAPSLISNDFQVLEAEMNSTSFRTIDGSFSMLLRDTSPIDDHQVEAFPLRDQNTYPTEQEENLPEQTDSNFRMLENRNNFGVAEIKPDYERSNQEAVEQQQGSQLSGFLSPPVFSPFRPIQNPIGSSRILASGYSSSSRFAIQRPFAPSTSYYTDSFLPPFRKFNGNTIHESQRAFGQVLTQQPVPLYQQSTAPQIPNYAPNYITYPYYSPFYVSPVDPHFASNSSFLPQPLVALPPMPQNGNADVTGHHYGDASFYVSGMQVMGSSYYSYHQGKPMGYGVVHHNHSAVAAAAGWQLEAPSLISDPNGFYHLHQAAQMNWINNY